MKMEIRWNIDYVEFCENLSFFFWNIFIIFVLTIAIIISNLIWIARFEIEIKDKGWKEGPKIMSFYKCFYHVKQIQDKMKKKHKQWT
jgi:hypothetical protein